jgi:hypothetical protein
MSTMSLKRFVARTFLAKVYQNDKYATRFYSPLPQVPVGPSEYSEWAKAARPNVPEYVRGLIHYQFAVRDDAARIVKFMEDNIIPNSPLFTSLGVNPTELRDFYEPIVERCLKTHASLLGFVGDQLVAVSLHTINDVSSPTSEKNPIAVEIVPTKDYGPLIEAACS